MRNALKTMVGMAFLAVAACGGKPVTTSGSNGTGTGGDGGTSTGLPPGAPCTSDPSCESTVCGVTGTGHCCLTKCSVGPPDDSCAIPTDCDDMGKCVYPPKGSPCGESCASDSHTVKTCDGAGGCSNPVSTSCVPLGCGATACNTSCTVEDGGCAEGFWCAPGSPPSCQPTVGGGKPCGNNTECSSGVCADGGFCCAHPCPHDQFPECVAFACTADAGACIYPPITTICDVKDSSCPNPGSTLNAGTCDGNGTCNLGGTPCPGNLACDQLGQQCVKSCLADSNCAKGYYCDPNSGDCIAKVADGGCSGDHQCLSNVCGTNGSGNCCLAKCTTVDAVCGATGCDGTTELCNYPDAGTACGKIKESCDNVKNVQTNPTICDGLGNCPAPNPPTTPCDPFVCNANLACDTTCTDNTACLPGDFCQLPAGSCCGPVGQTISVDGATGKDVPCCGFGAALSCLTITYAMNIIDSAQAKGVLINAVVHGAAAGDWNPVTEVYPIKLGWGVELSAAGIAFWDTVAQKAGVDAAVFDIAQFSKNDNVGYASILGNAAGPVILGYNTMNNKQSFDSSIIQVEDGQTLYIADAKVNGNLANLNTAITVVAGGSLVVGQDHDKKSSGTVTIGNANGAQQLDGYNGIVCGALGAKKTCTITDVSLGNVSSLVVEGQENVDIDAEDDAVVTLTANPVIGVAPSSAGFGNCNHKSDAATSKHQAVLLHGNASVTFENGTVQCISGQGFHLQASPAGIPTLTVQSSTIQNTEGGIVAQAGNVAVSSSTIQFNYTGVEQTTDGTNVPTINLDGSSDGGNTIICSSEKESIVQNQNTPGVDVLNTTSGDINADYVAWDSTAPDLFSCNAALAMCACSITKCADAAGADDMDAVTTSTGTITTANNTQSAAAVAAHCN